MTHRSITGKSYPITGVVGDQQAATIGQCCFQKGAVKSTYGTGAFILLNTGVEKVFSANGLLTTVAFKHLGKTHYALEGSCYIAGAAVQWLRDNLNLIETSPDVEALANSVENLAEMEHLLFLPFFTGMGSPHWNAQAKAAIVGLTRDSAPKHIARACLDGMALSINDSIQVMANESPSGINAIKVDGGASQNNLLMQIQANFSNMEIIRPKVIETTGYGVALGSQIGLGKIDFSDLDNLWKKDRNFIPVENDYFVHKQSQWNTYVDKLYK